MRRLLLGSAILMLAGPAAAQSWVPWQSKTVSEQFGPRSQREAAKPKPQPGGIFEPSSAAGAIPKPSAQEWSGGPRPSISPQAPQSTSIRTGYGAGTIVIDTSARRLYLMQSQTTALVYPISVGRVGFTWTGTQTISRVASWPDWRPPAEMRQRQPGLPVVMTGGLRNPLGAKALYLGSSLYRIHGTNSVQTIGTASSSGCFRMTNSHVIDLANRVGVGTTVVVKSKL